MQNRIVDTPLHAEAGQGMVFVEGGLGVALTMTPEAALATAESIMECVAEATAEAETGAVPRSEAGIGKSS